MLTDVFRIMSEKCGLLGSDIQGIIYKNRTGVKASRKSLEQTTILRKNSQELREAAAEDPDVQFIKDQLNNIIFGG